jgi:hypothetical protein
MVLINASIPSLEYLSLDRQCPKSLPKVITGQQERVIVEVIAEVFDYRVGAWADVLKEVPIPVQDLPNLRCREVRMALLDLVKYARRSRTLA